jgi:hypothetical protein
MISIMDLDAEDLEGIAPSAAMSNCRSKVTRDPSAAGDAAAEMLPDSISIVISLAR